MTQAPLLRTERMDLWQPAADDLAGLHALLQSEVTRRFLGSEEPTWSDMHARLLRNAGSWSLYGYGTFIVRERGGERVIGSCGVFHSWRGLGADFDDMPEAGWILAEDKAGQGHGREVMEAVMAWFDQTHGPRRTVCMIAPANTPSIRLAERLGYSAMRDTEFNGAPIRLFERRFAQR